MTNLSCTLAGMLHLLSAPALLLIWRKKANARLYPALIAFMLCMPIFVIGAAIRSCMNPEDFITYSLLRGLLYGILEEGGSYLGMRFLLEQYDSRKDAVTYGIGHSAWENFGSALTCFGLIGAETASPDIFWRTLFGLLEFFVFCIAVKILICYGIRTGKAKIMLPAAILLHMLSNAAVTVLIDEAAVCLRILLTIGAAVAAYRCWRALWDPYADEPEN